MRDLSDVSVRNDAPAVKSNLLNLVVAYILMTSDQLFPAISFAHSAVRVEWWSIQLSPNVGPVWSAFPVIAARVWNALPVDVISSTTLPAFKRLTDCSRLNSSHGAFLM